MNYNARKAWERRQAEEARLGRPILPEAWKSARKRLNLPDLPPENPLREAIELAAVFRMRQRGGLDYENLLAERWALVRLDKEGLKSENPVG